MTITTNVPPIQFTPQGVVVPAESAVLTGVQADYNAAFGGNLNPSLSTPQGQLASSLTAIIADKNDQFLLMLSQVDPATSDGRWQDALAQIYSLTRFPSLPTTVTLQCFGLASTPIPVNAQAIATDGNIYYCTEAAVIPASGSVFTQFACTIQGPIACPANTLNKIYQAIPGWDSVNNPVDGVPGENIETRSEFAYRMTQTVERNASGSVQAVYAGLFVLPNLIDAYVTENDFDTPLIIGDQILKPHSLWVCVAGAAALDIAAAIWAKKMPGCNFNGDTPTVVYDDNYNLPYPSYTINWWTATPTPILFAISIANSAFLPANAAALIQAAIIGAFSGQDGGTVARIGSTLYASRYYAPILGIATNGTAIEILSLLLGIGAASAASVVMGIDQIPTITASNIVVTFV